jgi:hypothetical protein
MAVNYVLSAHGEFNGGIVRLLPNFQVQFYTNPGETLQCTRYTQTQVCIGTSRMVDAWRHSGVVGDYNLTADRAPRGDPNSFLSGIKDCYANVIVFDLTKFDRDNRSVRNPIPYVTFDQCMQLINQYHSNTYGNIPAIVHFLACRDVAASSEEMINAITGLPASRSSFLGGKRKTRKHKRKQKKTRRSVSKP